MAMADIGKAYIQIVPSAQGITGNVTKLLNKEAGGAGKSAGKGFSAKFGSVVAKGLAALGAAKLIKDSLGLGAELEQNLGGTEAVFGKWAGNIQETAESAYKNMGMSASNYMATANKMGALFQGSGISQTKSLKMTEDAMQRAADVASVMGVDMEMAMESVAGAAKGNFTMMDNLGVAMNATTLQAYALEKGMNFDWKTASNAQKAEVAMKMFMDRTSQYAGNFARESEQTLSGSIGMVKAAYEDLLANLATGGDVSGAMSNLAKSASTALFDNIIPAIGNILMALPDALMGFIQTAAVDISQRFSGVTVEALPDMLLSALHTVTGILSKAMAGEGAFLKMAQSVFDKVTSWISANGPGIVKSMLTKVVPAAVSAVMMVGQMIIKALPTIVSGLGNVLMALLKSLWSGVGDSASIAVAEVGKAVEKGFGKISKNIKDALAPLRGIVSSIFNGVKNAVMAPIKAAQKLVKGAVHGIVKAFDAVKGIVARVRSAFNKAREAIEKPIKKARDTVKSIVDKITGLFPINIGKIFSSFKTPHLDVSYGSISALGKTVKFPKDFDVKWYKKAAAVPYLFKRGNRTLFGSGDARDELLYGRKNLMDDIREASPGGSTYNVTLIANERENPEEFAHRFGAELNRMVRTA